MEGGTDGRDAKEEGTSPGRGRARRAKAVKEGEMRYCNTYQDHPLRRGRIACASYLAGMQSARGAFNRR